jgi:Glycine zipper
MRSSIKTLFIAPALVLAAACSKDKPADATLSNDLTLAAQAKQTATLDSITAAERTKAAAIAAAPVAVAQAPRASAPARSTVHHRTASSSNGTYSEPAPRGTVTEKNTKRDAVVGAAAGAVLGGATHGVKGGIIGAAAGGILGGIIGNNVDIKKKPAP